MLLSEKGSIQVILDIKILKNLKFHFRAKHFCISFDGKRVVNQCIKSMKNVETRYGQKSVLKASDVILSLRLWPLLQI